jgi:hypothetical protein
MNKQTLQSFNADALVALSKIAAEHGMGIKAGTSRFGSANATLKFELSDITSEGEVLTPEAQAFKVNAARYGLHPDDLYGTFNYQEKQWRIVGLKTRRPKFPICVENVKTGRRHKFPESIMRTVSVAQKGTGRRAAIAAQKGELSSDIKREFHSLASQLSPETLSWDGERSAAETRKAASRLNARWNELEKQIGRQVTESEAFGFSK